MSGIYTYTQNASNLSANAMNRAKTFSEMTKDGMSQAASKATHEVGQAYRSGTTNAMDSDTRKVTSTTFQAAAPVVAADLSVAWAHHFTARSYETAMNAFASQVNDMRQSGAWAAMEVKASEMGISISNTKDTKAAAGLGLNNVQQFGTNGANPVTVMNIDGGIMNRGTFVEGVEYKNGNAHQKMMVLNDYNSTVNGSSLQDSMSVVKVERNGNATFDIYKNFVNQETGDVSSELAITINEKQVETFIKNGRIDTTLEEFRRMNAESGSFTMDWNMREDWEILKHDDIKGRHGTGVFDRSPFQYSVNGNKIAFINLGDDAKNHMDMYDTFLRNAKHQLKSLDPSSAEFAELKDLMKQVNGLQNKLGTMAAKQARYARLTNPVKKLARPFRLLTKPLQESEVWKGVSMTEQVGRPVIWAAKKASLAVHNIAYNNILRAKWALQARRLMKTKAEATTFKGAFAEVKAMSGKELVSVRKLFKFNPITTALRNRVLAKYYALKTNNLQMFADRLAKKGLTDAAGYLNAQKEFMMNKLAFKQGNMTKQQLKAAKKELKMARRNMTRIGKALNGIAEKRAAARAFASGLKNAFLNTKVGTPFRIIGELFAKLRAALQQLFAKIAEVIAAIGQALLIGLVILIVVVLVLMGINIGIHAFYDAHTEESRFASSDASKWEEYSEKLFTMLEGEHKNFVAKIETEMKKYPTADVQYPSGAKENYKEIFATIEIQAQYNPGKELSYEEMEDIAKDMYERTHKIKTMTYAFDDVDGTEHGSGTDQAAHIFVNVLREDAVCYEIFQEEDMITGQGLSGTFASAPVECAPDDWLSVVRAVKEAIASSGTPYSQSNYITITVNGQTFSQRPDCSGFVSTCLWLYEPSSAAMSGPSSQSSRSLNGMYVPGFQSYKYSGAQNLGVGDILVKDGHTEIYAGYIGGRHTVYNCGTNDSVASAVPTGMSYSDYTWVIRPNAAGSGGVNTDGKTGSEEKAPVGTMFSNDDDLNLPLSNMAGIEFNEKTGNQDGYEAGLLATIEAAKSEPKFGYGYFRTGNKDHTLGDKTTGTTGSDFVRYILSKHGVQFMFDDDDMFFSSEPIAFFTDKSGKTINSKRMKLRAGDILFYCPSTNAINTVKAKQKNKMMINLDPGSAENKTVNIDGVDKTYMDVLSENAVPLIYDGSKWVGYCKDITANASGYTSSGGAIRYYATSDLDASRVLNVVRETGFTVEPVYGSTPYFEGWTDYHIAELMEIIQDECWTTGKAEFYISGGSATADPINVTDVLAEDEETKKDSIDYSWYHEDYFQGGDTWTSNTHDETFINELIPLFIRHYNENGVLPSFGSSYVMSITHNRSTEESLKDYNIFELTNSGGAQHMYTEYSYDSDGMANTTQVSYIHNSSYYESLQMWVRRNKDTGLLRPNKYKEEIAAGTAFNNQFSALQNAGVIRKGGHIDSTGTYADDTKAIYAKYASTLIEADKVAQERYEKIEAVKDAADKWNDALNASPYKEVGGKGTQDQYNALKAKFKNYENAVKELQSWEADSHNGYSSYAFITQSEADVLWKAYSELKSGNENMSNAKVDKITGYEKMETTGEKRSGVGHYYPNTTTEPLPQPDRDGNIVMIPPGKVVYIRDSKKKYDHDMPVSKTLTPITKPVSAEDIYTADVNSIYEKYKETVSHKDENRCK